MEKSRWRAFTAHLGRSLVRALIATTLLWVAVSVPLPRLTPQLFVMVQVPIAVFIFIVYIGKLLIDTFFYDRYCP